MNANEDIPRIKKMMLEVGVMADTDDQVEEWAAFPAGFAPTYWVDGDKKILVHDVISAPWGDDGEWEIKVSFSDVKINDLPITRKARYYHGDGEFITVFVKKSELMVQKNWD